MERILLLLIRAFTRARQTVREPSTWAAVAAIAAVTSGADAHTTATIASGVSGIVESPSTWASALPVLVPAILGIVLPEGGGKQNDAES